MSDQLYLRGPPEQDMRKNSLQYWIDNRTAFPEFASVVVRYLSTIATFVLSAAVLKGRQFETRNPYYGVCGSEVLFLSNVVYHCYSLYLHIFNY